MFVYNPEKVNSPILEADSTYRSLRRKGIRRLSRDERALYFFSRMYRTYPRQWEKSHKPVLLRQMQESVESTGNWLDTWREFLTWMTEYVAPQATRGDRKAYSFFYDKVESIIEDVQTQYDQAIDSDGVTEEDSGEIYFANLIEEIHAAGVGLGLEPHPVFEPGVDGAVWFIDPETQLEYFTIISNAKDLTNGYTVNLMVLPDLKNDRWKVRGIMDLSTNGFIFTKVHGTDDPTRCFRDYFGYFNHSLRPYMESAEVDSPVEWE